MTFSIMTFSLMTHVIATRSITTVNNTTRGHANRGHIFSCVRPFYERSVSDLDRSMHRSLWVYVAHSSFIEGSHMTKNTASG